MTKKTEEHIVKAIRILGSAASSGNETTARTEVLAELAMGLAGLNDEPKPKTVPKVVPKVEAKVVAKKSQARRRSARPQTTPQVVAPPEATAANDEKKNSPPLARQTEVVSQP